MNEAGLCIFGQKIGKLLREKPWHCQWFAYHETHDVHACINSESTGRSKKIRNQRIVISNPKSRIRYYLKFTIFLEQLGNIEFLLLACMIINGCAVLRGHFTTSEIR
jgi:hypothetical protein